MAQPQRIAASRVFIDCASLLSMMGYPISRSKCTPRRPASLPGPQRVSRDRLPPRLQAPGWMFTNYGAAVMEGVWDADPGGAPHTIVAHTVFALGSATKVAAMKMFRWWQWDVLPSARANATCGGVVHANGASAASRLVELYRIQCIVYALELQQHPTRHMPMNYDDAVPHFVKRNAHRRMCSL